MSTEIKQVQQIKFHIQDKEYTVNVDDVSPTTSLNSYIRDTLQLTGTKGVCFEGGCGACTVVLYMHDPNTEKNIYLAVNSCLIPLLSCNGWTIYTIEGIGDPLNGYHVVQETLATFNGTQCGMCSPGMVMNMYALYESGKLTMKDVENSFGGSICRCTGYRPILSAFKSLCTDVSPEILGHYPDIEDLKICKKDKCEKKCTTKCDKRGKEPFYLQMAAAQWIKVFSLSDLLSALSTSGGATYKLVAGNTAMGVFSSYRASVDIYIDVTSVPELKVSEFVGETYVLGANTTLTTAMDVFNEVGAENPQFSYFIELANHIDLIANVPVRNTGTIAGNLIMKHDNHDFPSDIYLILETVGAKLTIVGVDGQEAQLSPEEFISQDMNLKVLKTITFPSYLMDNVKFVSYKIMPRAQNTHANVNAGFLFQFNINGTLDSATIVYGNINPTFTHATATETLLAGKDLFDDNVLQQALTSLSSELICDVIPPDPSPDYRKQLAMALFYKTVLAIAPADKLSPKNQSGGAMLERPISTGVQDYETNASLYPLTQAIPKIEALAQTSGQAQYVSDLPDSPHQLFGTLILADAPPNSTLKSIDASKALEVEGVVAFYSKDDIPGDNNFTPLELFFQQAEEIFCSGRVHYHHQPIGILVGESEAILRTASSLVEATYDPPTVGPLLSIRQVLQADRTDRIQEIRTIEPTRKGTDITHVVKGTFDIYHQYHFHLEQQCCSVVPNENGMDIFPSTQWMDQIQIAVAKMLQIPNNKIQVSVRRLGGGFGAKISRNGLVSCATALAAWKLRRPVKVNLSFSDNVQAIGKRFPFSSDYEVGLNDQGVIQYLTCTHYSDLGASINEIPYGEILNDFLGSYVNDTFEIHMKVAVTDTHNNTWARAPGSTEGVGSIEAIMEHCAVELGMDPIELKKANFQQTPISTYIDELKTWADIDTRKADIETFNQENRWKKKGLAVVNMTYNLGASGPFSVMVSIFHGDGTVQISHGGIEMGQGINTKAAQVCAYKFGIDLNFVAVLPSNSFTCPNNVVTGGSVTSEAVCYGVIQACDQLIARIQPYKDKNPNGTWPDWITACHEDFVNLAAIGMFSPKEPNVNEYPIYGVCACEVIIDILTGQHIVNRVDLLEDVGRSMSPLVDIGQVEGAFIMGLGYYTTEEIVYNYEGKILTDRTWNYRPPGAKDIPVDFRVQLKKNNPNPVGVLYSKATAEPPLCLSIVVPLAIRNALASARLDAASTNAKWFPIDGPTTIEKVFVNSLNDYKQYVL
ncbi:hypothetical protein Zmor_003192 [Zophobas morio]|uniref:Indole-3-acetaldehyde oxidase n=1 Tax=Zophobas morio TaxID=2755281 RepID=A0AA38HME5_9CUCU|nr:hypothetical protein Zmor_003192 [Zophobas morio]